MTATTPRTRTTREATTTMRRRTGTARSPTRSQCRWPGPQQMSQSMGSTRSLLLPCEIRRATRAGPLSRAAIVGRCHETATRRRPSHTTAGRCRTRAPAMRYSAKGRRAAYRRRMAMRHDEAFKFLFGLPAVCADLLRVAAPGLWPQLDPHSVRNLRVGDSVAADLTRRTGDALCRIDLQAAKLPDGRPAYLVVPVEFQSGDDQDMAGRMGEYVVPATRYPAPPGNDTRRRHAAGAAGGRLRRRGPVVRAGRPWSRCGHCPPTPPPTLRRSSRRRTCWLTWCGRGLDDWPWDNRLRAVAQVAAAGRAGAARGGARRGVGAVRRRGRVAVPPGVVRVGGRVVDKAVGGRHAAAVRFLRGVPPARAALALPG